MNLQRVVDRIDEAQQRRTWLAFPVAVFKKFSDDRSSNLAVLITYYAFFSVFPLLLAMASILGYVLKSHPDWARKIDDSAASKFPLINGPLPKHGSVIIVVIGVLLALYSGLGVAKAAQNAWDTVYRVPEAERPGILPKNLRALRLVAVGGLSLVVTTVVSSIIASAGAIGVQIGPALSVVGYLVTLLLNVATFAFIFRFLTVRKVGFRDVLPGAVLSAVVLGILQTAASAFIAHKSAGANATYGSFGTVIILLSWFFLQSQVLLIAAQLNVVKQDHLWPRSLRESAPDTAGTA